MKIYAAKKGEKVVASEPISTEGKEVEIRDIFKSLGITSETGKNVMLEDDGTINRGRSL